MNPKRPITLLSLPLLSILLVVGASCDAPTDDPSPDAGAAELELEDGGRTSWTAEQLHAVLELEGQLEVPLSQIEQPEWDKFSTMIDEMILPETASQYEPFMSLTDGWLDGDTVDALTSTQLVVDSSSFAAEAAHCANAPSLDDQAQPQQGSCGSPTCSYSYSNCKIYCTILGDMIQCVQYRHLYEYCYDNCACWSNTYNVGC